MRFITNFPLRITIPFFLFAAGIIISAYSLIHSLRVADAEVENSGVTVMMHDMSVLQGSVNSFLREGNIEEIKLAIADAGSAPNAELLLLADENNVVLHATRVEFVGLPLQQALPDIDADLVSNAKKRMAGKTLISKNRDSISAYFPVVFGAKPDELRPSRVGILFAEYDLTYMKAAHQYEIERQTWQSILLYGLLFLSLGIFLHYVLTKRLQSLVNATTSFAAGDTTAHSGLQGKDEIARIGESFDKMIEKIIIDQATLGASEEQFRAIFERSTIGKSLSAQDGKLLRVNKAFADMLGYSIEEMSEINFAQITHPDDLEASRECVRILLAGEQTTYRFEKRYIHKNSTIVWADLSTTMLYNEHGTSLNLITNIVDIGDRKRAEEENSKLEEQLLQSQKMEAVGQLAGGVAHDFNNMLGVILGHSELALMKLEPSQPLYAGLTEIRKAAERSADLTRQLLAFARKQTIAPKVIDLNETVTGMLKMLQRLIGENSRLTWQPASNLWPVKVDPSQIDQILANLCVNARDAITDVGRITIETGNKTVDASYYGSSHEYVETGEYVRLTVSDDGCGMDKETVSHIFEPFYTTKGLGKGTGLGLSTVYGIVKQNKGFVNVYSEPGHGTTFTIYLPRHKGKSLDALKGSAAEPVPTGTETILLVEDEPTILNMAATILEVLGYTVLAANSTSEAIRLFKEHAGTIQMLMTDVVMPDMNGRDLAKELLLLNPQLSCLFMSGYTANVIAHHGVLDEGVNLIQKPFSMHDLATKVREVLDGK